MSPSGLLRISVLFFSTLLYTAPCHSAEWKTKVKTIHYSISGTTGRALYASIGENGPRLKGGRQTIAITDFDLKWRRKFTPNGKSCTLTSALPFFTIEYTLPKPAKKLSGSTARQWKTFYQGIATHEKVHGTYAREMVKQIIDMTVGLTIQNDPKCKKIRAEVLTRVKTAYRDYKAKGRRFDRTDMAPGGNIRQLVHGLISSK